MISELILSFSSINRRLARTNGFIRLRIDSNEVTDPDSVENERLPSPALAISAGVNSPEILPFNNNSMNKNMSNASMISSAITNSSGNLDLENNISNTNIENKEQSDAVLIDLDIDGREEDLEAIVKSGSINSIELSSVSINSSSNANNSNMTASNSKIREGLSHVNDPKYKLFRWSNIV